MLFRQTPTPSPKTEEVHRRGRKHIISINPEQNFKINPCRDCAGRNRRSQKIPEKISKASFCITTQYKIGLVKDNSAFAAPFNGHPRHDTC